MVQPITLFPPNGEKSIYIKLLEDSAIVFGSAGTVLNSFLFWIITNNTGVDRKCCVIYKNLAAIDGMNSLLMMLCYLSINMKVYDMDQYTIQNSIMYTFIGATINIPYLLLIILGIARIMIFQHQLFYANQLEAKFVYIICTLIWVVGIGAPVGIWLLYLALTQNYDTRNHAKILKRVLTYESALLAMLIIITSLIMLSTIIKINRFRVGTMSMDTQLRSLANELRSAVRTFTLFFLSDFIWSLFPFLFAVMFVICGPEYIITMPGFCQTFHSEIFTDTNASYALVSISLCCMSISNCGILLSQKSFVNTVKIK